MPYLIDGNNLMMLRAKVKDFAVARRALLDELAVYKQRKNITLTVVFDGRADEHFPDESSYRGVKVCYARQGSDADARIKEIVESSRERRTLIVITNDRALGEYVKRCGARVVKCQEFRAQVDLILAAKNSPRDVPPQLKDVDEWMRYFGVDANE